MRELGLCAVQPRVYKRTTVVGDGSVVCPDLIERELHRTRTALRRRHRPPAHGQSWLYLGTVLDLHPMVVGRQTAGCMRTSLVVVALTMAMRGEDQPGAAFHSDRGSRYTSTGFAVFARQNPIRTSAGRTGVCWDNAVAESWFATLKNEMYYQSIVPDPSRARFAVAEYIEASFNRQRFHWPFGYRPPIEAISECR